MTKEQDNLGRVYTVHAQEWDIIKRALIHARGRVIKLSKQVDSSGMKYDKVLCNIITDILTRMDNNKGDTVLESLFKLSEWDYSDEV